MSDNKKEENKISFEKYCTDNNLQHLISEWDNEKNGSLSLQKVSPFSSKKVWWKCDKGHEWQAIIANRIRWSNCPYCSGKKVCEDNCLSTTHPKLAAEWNQEKNGSLTPHDVSRGSVKKVWWKCKNGHEWQATVNSRTTHNTGCPLCLGRVPSKEHNLAIDCPEILKEWNYERNGDISPQDFTKGSDKKVWWKCEDGHEWQASINHRTGAKSAGCPYCSGLLVTDNDLESKDPRVAKLWDQNKNEPLTPKDIAWKSYKLVWWKCENGHEWRARVSDMTSKNLGCPYCSGKRVSQTNNLEELFPEIAKEWDYEKNNGLTPRDVTSKSQKKVWWKCDKGHSWESVIGNRTGNGTGCPVCNNKSTSFPEQAILFYCQKYFPSTVSRDKSAIGLELDIFIPEKQVGIEYDGKYWHKGEKVLIDHKKEVLCQEKGIQLIRVIEKGLNNEHDESVTCIKRKGISLADLDRTIGRVLFVLGIHDYEEGALFDDLREIRERCNSVESDNSISLTNPELLHEWDYDKNGALRPEQFTSGSGQKVWWKCKNEHSWLATIHSRTSGNGCPYCSGKKVCEDNCLQNVYPDIAKEWNYEKNNGLTPRDIFGRSGQQVWWKCEKGHEWMASPYKRTRSNMGCPYCGGQKVLSGFNDLASQFPHLLTEWDYSKNTGMNPAEEYMYSPRNAHWKCSKCGFEWVKAIRYRARGVGCPACAGKAAVPGYNDLASKYPELIKEWNYEKNGDLTPEMVLSKSSKKVWWKCSSCGHEWETAIAHRTSGSKCPICSRKKKL